jgi:hypothetical protein
VGGGTASISATVTGFTYTYDHTLQECFEHSKTLSASSTCDVMMPKYVVLNSSTSIQGLCIPSPPPGVERDYSAYDANLLKLPMSLNWKLNETVTSQSNCGVKTDGSASSPDFVDDIYNCQAGCTFQSNQTFQVTLPNGQVVVLQAKDCVQTSCSPHTGWHVTATTGGVTVTDN